MLDYLFSGHQFSISNPPTNRSNETPARCTRANSSSWPSAMSRTNRHCRMRGEFGAGELDIMGRWSKPADQLRAVEWVNGLRNSLQPFALGAYVNQFGETSELVRAAYGPHYARLAPIKRKYDPTNAFAPEPDQKTR